MSKCYIFKVVLNPFQAILSHFGKKIGLKCGVIPMLREGSGDVKHLLHFLRLPLV